MIPIRIILDTVFSLRPPKSLHINKQPQPLHQINFYPVIVSRFLHSSYSLHTIKLLSSPKYTRNHHPAAEKAVNVYGGKMNVIDYDY
jgi:hypothetical protein